MRAEAGRFNRKVKEPGAPGAGLTLHRTRYTPHNQSRTTTCPPPEPQNPSKHRTLGPLQTCWLTRERLRSREAARSSCKDQNIFSGSHRTLMPAELRTLSHLVYRGPSCSDQPLFSPQNLYGATNKGKGGRSSWAADWSTEPGQRFPGGSSLLCWNLVLPLCLS